MTKAGAQFLAWMSLALVCMTLGMHYGFGVGLGHRPDLARRLLGGVFIVAYAILQARAVVSLRRRS